MIVHKFTSGIFAVNNYLIQSSTSAKAVLIDAGEQPEIILKKIDELNVELVYLIDTHGHGDHIAGNSAILENTAAKLLIHPKDEPFLSDPNLNLSAAMGFRLISPPADRLLEEGDIVEVEDIRLEVLHTPGHTPGHITLVAGEAAFVGDVIFRDSIGRTDFPHSNFADLEKSIRGKIYALPDETILYNGHGPETTVGYEKIHNPFVKAS